ncbi:hypothetical protein LOAG_10789 [Loa loa]|uniref:Uncharacterized protein n=1 Tax=Loa loa TaxID=7209 RepID=A0A1I7VQ00_LOALO|nr:hypothetical protein LOAG_10789 [Loa loa]EFO17710.2 hypothetical protein LOAG_10789 [Loa loa]
MKRIHHKEDYMVFKHAARSTQHAAHSTQTYEHKSVSYYLNLVGTSDFSSRKTERNVKYKRQEVVLFGGRNAIMKKWKMRKEEEEKEEEEEEEKGMCLEKSMADRLKRLVRDALGHHFV